MKFPTLIQRTTLLLAAFAPTTQCSPYSSTTARPARIAPNSAFLKSFSEQTSLPACIWTAKGTHTAKGYTNAAAETTSIEGMQADCDNINLNKKLASDFRSDVFGPEIKRFFYQCDRYQPILVYHQFSSSD
ncbi:hypothetical protein BDV29DRAFT_159801 [Aspergillus leporis]|uniref:Uncharacterized protein n=1 Tax=Aspergillus leporis TaxID=41062 RepID=A0A5N5WVB6_9EURO|nr:hypothetical protein BDV29DRAFT_159801 [Aspergillus leporis]